MMLEDIVADMMLLYEDIDRQTSNFARQTGLRCKPGCSACCENPDIETTVAEVLPVALRLWAESQAQRTLEAIQSRGKKGGCVFYQPQRAQGCCSIYTHRPGLCRLFGLCARRDKHGQPSLITCKIIKEAQKQACAQAQQQLHQGLEAPLLGLHALRVSHIDPVGGMKLLPINQAVGLALEKVGFYSIIKIMGAKKKILFIDDNPVDRTLISRLLKKSGFDVFLAEDGKTGQTIAQDKDPDLIILDILLPGISGIELCKYFKTTQTTEHTPVIFYTSIDTPKHLIDYASYGAQDYIQKTMPPEELLNSIRSILKI